MPLLAYCMMEAAAGVDTPLVGVGGARVEELQESGLRCFFSRFESREHLSRIPALESALAFHQVVQALFRQAGLISFRFPTLVENEEELLRYLRERGPRYTSELSRLRHMVQMEVHISSPEQAKDSSSASGREYLQQRQARAAGLEAAAEKFRQTARGLALEWRERTTGEGMRCYVLLHRDAVAAFRNATQELRQSLPGTRLSGPWPPAEFSEAIKES